MAFPELPRISYVKMRNNHMMMSNEPKGLLPAFTFAIWHDVWGRDAYIYIYIWDPIWAPVVHASYICFAQRYHIGAHHCFLLSITATHYSIERGTTTGTRPPDSQDNQTGRPVRIPSAPGRLSTSNYRFIGPSGPLARFVKVVPLLPPLRYSELEHATLRSRGC